MIQGESPLDELQVEYLSQIIWSRSVVKEIIKDGGHDIHELQISKLDGKPNEMIDSKEKEYLAKNLAKTWRHHSTPNFDQASKPKLSFDAAHHAEVVSNTTIKKRIRKHGLDKPKIVGRVETSSILTDVA